MAPSAGISAAPAMGQPGRGHLPDCCTAAPVDTLLHKPFTDASSIRHSSCSHRHGGLHSLLMPVCTLHQLRVGLRGTYVCRSAHLYLCLQGSPLAGILLPAAFVYPESLMLRCLAGHYDSEAQGSHELAAKMAEAAEPATSGDEDGYITLTGHEACPRGALQHDLLRGNDEQEAALLQPAGVAAQHWHQAGKVDSAERFAQAGHAAGHWAQPEGQQQQQQPDAVQTAGEQWTQQLEAMQSDVQEWAGPGESQHPNWDHRLQTEQQQGEAGAQGAHGSTSSDERWQDSEGADENAGITVLQQQQQQQPVPVQHRGGGKQQQQQSGRPAGAAPLRPAGVHTTQPGAARGVQAALNKARRRQGRPHRPRAVHMAQCMAVAASGGALTRLAERYSHAGKRSLHGGAAAGWKAHNSAWQYLLMVRH